MKKVTYFDAEWANNKNKSICQMGIMCENFEDDEPIYPEKNIYINPQDKFDDICIQKHGITADKVANKPTFPEIWKEIEPCFTKSIIIGHNAASADLDALTKNLQRYNIDIPELYYIDTYVIAKTFIPSFAVKNYKMATLCSYFGVDIDNEHDAFDDACSCKGLFLAMKKRYNFQIDKFVCRYIPNDNYKFIGYVSNPQLRKDISEFYGIIQGINIDNQISTEEFAYIKNWRENHRQYSEYREIADILFLIDKIVEDGVIHPNELQILHKTMAKYFQTLSSSETTIATQTLLGILKGIASDNVISDCECKKLLDWLYDHDNLKGHYPFDKIINLLDDILKDNYISKAEGNYLLSEIDKILNPVATLKCQIQTVKGLNVCLSGNFAYGQKADVAKYIESKGGIVVSSVSKKLNILLIGDLECDAYAHDTFGTKIKKALELNEKGCNIEIITEKEFFSQK